MNMKKRSERRPQAGLDPKSCAVCGATFQPYRAWTRACSRACSRRLPPLPAEALEERLVECSRCGDEFTVLAAPNVGFGHRYCGPCKPVSDAEAAERKNAARRLATAKDPGARRAQNRRRAVAKYGMTVEDHDAMLAAQDGVCAICGNPPDPDGVRAASRLHIDHDHATGRVRGLLCNLCNVGIGKFRDDVDLLAGAMAYLLLADGDTPASDAGAAPVSARGRDQLRRDGR